MPVYSSRYVHKIAPSPADTGRDVTIDALLLAAGETAVAPARRQLDCKSIGRILRAAGMLTKGGSVYAAYVFGNGEIVAFPRASIWHSIILTPKA